jgi:hypothetical protein
LEKGGNLTVFGATVLELMSRRGLRTWTALSALLEDYGFYYKPSRISNWAFGRHAVDRYFGHALATALDLTPDERGRLADAFLFGQDKPISEVKLLAGSSRTSPSECLPVPETKRH